MSTFKNEKLQNAHINIEDTIGSHLAQLDAVSNDIKALETVLANAGISFTFKYLFHKTFLQETLNREYFDGDVYEMHSYDHDGVKKTNHYIIWDREKKKLIYEVEEMACEYKDKSKTVLQVYNANVALSVALHDSKVHVRLKVQNELHFFYTQIIEKLKKGGLEDLIVEESPNIPVDTSLSDEEIPF